MPANKKYLTQSPLQRFLKITAGFVGGFIITEAFHMVLALWFDNSLCRFYALGCINDCCFFSKKRMENMGDLSVNYPYSFRNNILQLKY